MSKKPKNPSQTFESYPYVLNMAVMKDEQGRYRTMNLFKEMSQSEEKYAPIFTMKDYHREELPSFKRLYMEVADPLEYKTAMAMLGSWDHWKKLTEANWFKPLIEECREELTIKLRSESLDKIKKDSDSAFSESARLAANKFLATQGYLTKEEAVGSRVANPMKNKRGRPSNEEVARNMHEIIKEEGMIEADYDRVVPLNISSEDRQKG